MSGESFQAPGLDSLRGFRLADFAFARLLDTPRRRPAITELFPDFSGAVTSLTSPEVAIRRVALAIVPAARPTPRAKAFNKDSFSRLFFMPRSFEAVFFTPPLFAFRDFFFRTGLFAFTSAPPQPISRR